MDIKNVWIEEGCITCGLCGDLCPEVFTVEDTAYVNVGVNYDEHKEKIAECVESCPVEVIKYLNF